MSKLSTALVVTKAETPDTVGDGFIRVREAAMFLGLSIAMVYRLMDEGELKRMFGGDVSAPVLTDNARVVAGREMLDAYLNELKTFVRDWQLFQNNCCYVDDDGETR